MAGGAFLYWLFEVLALCVMVKYMICQLAILMDRDAGNKIGMAIEAIVFTVLSTLGFACWWGITGTGYDADCEYEDAVEDLMDGDPAQFCAGSGATVGIIAFALMFLAGILGVANSFMQSDLVEIKYSQEVPMCCGPKVH